MRRILQTLVVVSLLVVMHSFVGCGNVMKGARAKYIVKQMHDPKSKTVLVVSHRGDWRNYPENSIPAIESVIRMGADMVEIDVQLTRDSVLVLMHDGTIDRTTTGKGRVSQMTYDEIQQYYLKDAQGKRYSEDLKVPTLREALEVCKDRIMVNLDKCYPHYAMVVDLTEELGVTNQVLIKGGMPLSDITKKMSPFENNLLYMPIITPTNTRSLKIFEEYIAADKPQLAYEVCFGKLTPEVEQCMKDVIADGSKLWVNTLWNSLCGGLSDDVAWNSSADEVYGKLIDMGVTIIQTDRPEFLLNYLREKGLHD